MTNPSKIGADYERTYRTLMHRSGYHTMRAAASKGLFDLMCVNRTGCWHVQLKKRRWSCTAASAYAETLKAEIPEECSAIVVHYTKDDPFCTHLG